MDEKKLDQILSQMTAPEPDENARKTALNLANAEFEKNTQGNENPDRLTDSTNNLRSIIMSTILNITKPRLLVTSVAIVAIGVGVTLYQGNDYLRDSEKFLAAPEETSVEGGTKIPNGQVVKTDKNARIALGESDDEVATLVMQQQIPAGPMHELSSPMSNKQIEEHIANAPIQDKAPLMKLYQEKLGREAASAEKTSGGRRGEVFFGKHKGQETISVGSGAGATNESKEIVASEPVVRKDYRMPIMNQVRTATSSVKKEIAQKPQAFSNNFSNIIGQRSRHMGIAADSIAPYPQPIVEQERGSDFEAFEQNQVKVVSEEPVSTFSVDVDTSSYSAMRSALNRGTLPNRNGIRVEELINYFDYDYAVPEDKAVPFKPTVAVYPSPWNAESKLVHIGIKGHEMTGDKPASNIVFLLDVSGSMNQPTKLPLLKQSFRLFLDTLQPDDTVGIVVYAGAAGAVLEPTKVSDKHKILSALDNLRAGGSTAGAQGIRQAYEMAQAHFKKDGVNRVMLATDGDFNVGIRNQNELKKYIETKRKTGVFLSVLGFGNGRHNDALMQKLAQNGNGVAAYIDTINEAQKVLVEEASSTLYPIAKDVKIQVEFNPATVSDYRLVGYETRALKRQDFNNDKVDAGDIGAGHTVTAIYEITPVGATNTRVDPLRYGSAEKKVAPSGNKDEYALLRMRYKLPNEDTSKLIEEPILIENERESIAETSNDIRFAASVAGFGQLLKQSGYVADYDYEKVINMAVDAKGRDPFGYRAEFVNLVRLAKSLDTVKRPVAPMPQPVQPQPYYQQPTIHGCPTGADCMKYNR